MIDWRSRLTALVRFGKDLPEPMNVDFRARPSTGRLWPKGLPACPALVELYTLCDGGFFLCWDFFALRRVKAESAALQGGLDQPAEPAAGIRQALLGYGSDHFSLIWDSLKDEVIAASPHPDESYPLAPSFATFVEELFTPKLADDELPELWVATLRHLDGLAQQER
jgi:hypothetical protein